jgi:hypothetical protein
MSEERDYELEDIQATEMWELGYSDGFLKRGKHPNLKHPQFQFSYDHGYQIGTEDLNEIDINKILGM